MPKRTDIHKVLIIGSAPIIIGQACEFDASGTQACKALRALGYEWSAERYPACEDIPVPEESGEGEQEEGETTEESPVEKND